MNESLPWTMLVTNSVGGQKILEMGQIEVVRTLPVTSVNQDDEQVSNEGGGVLKPLIAVLCLISLFAASGLLYRKRIVGDSVEKMFDEPLENLQSEPTTSEGLHEEPVSVEEDSVQAEVAPHGPPANAQPTSVDQDGFEWYSTADGHWYRPAGSGAEWMVYEA